MYPEVNVQKEKFCIKLKFPDNDDMADLELGLTSVSYLIDICLMLNFTSKLTLAYFQNAIVEKNRPEW